MSEESRAYRVLSLRFNDQNVLMQIIAAETPFTELKPILQATMRLAKKYPKHNLFGHQNNAKKTYWISLQTEGLHPPPMNF